jgi:cullin-associated NEDD8-dissociated protein 1
MAALTDTNEVKVLGLMLLLRLGQLSPSSVVPRLDNVVESMKAMMMDLEVKDDTIQQDLERKGMWLQSSAETSEVRWM